MQQAWDNVKALIDELRPLLLQAGIPERQVTMPDADPTDIKTERYVEIFDWLHDLSASEEYAAAVKARALVPEYVWKNYEVNEITGLQEQLILEKANIALRRRWKQNRPHFFGRKFKKHEEEATEQDPDQEGAE